MDENKKKDLSIVIAQNLKQTINRYAEIFLKEHPNQLNTFMEIYFNALSTILCSDLHSSFQNQHVDEVFDSFIDSLYHNFEISKRFINQHISEDT